MENDLGKLSMPGWLEPMKATLAREPLLDGNWLYERKLDGVRILTYKAGGDVNLFTRNQKRRDDAYYEIKDALAQQKGDFIIDGEVVAFDGKITSFQRLQDRIGITDANRARDRGVEIFYYVFDILWAQGDLLTGASTLERKERLRNAVDFKDPIRYVEHRKGDGEMYLEEACKNGWEGLVAKEASSKYYHKRSRKWLKLKCSKRQEFVVGGYTDPKGGRMGFGALLIGYYDDGEFRYAGKVGTGYDDDFLREFSEQLDSIECKASPFSDEVREKDVHFVTPRFVADVSFTEWTSDGKLRHPVFLGIRHDKEPWKVKREI